MNFLKKLEPFALLLLRLGLALVFMFHGYPKLFGETDRYTEAFRNIGLPPFLSYVTGVIEFFGGAALGLGVLTPIAGLLLLLDMCGAMWKYNLSEGVFAVREYELPLVLGLASLAVAAMGGGRFSLDQLFFPTKSELNVDSAP
jgi:putative oxidoreductase